MGDSVTALTLGYDGLPFHGFARQDGLPTVQGSVEDALLTLLQRPVETVGAGRTDAGVHALGQVMSYEADMADPDADTIRRSLNGLLAPSIAVSEVRHARAGFSARFDAVRREYRYRVVGGPVPPVALGGRSWWIRKPLDLEAMSVAAESLLGEHDFAAFCVTQSAEGKNTVRTLDEIEMFREEQLGEESLVIRVVGKAFLHSMIRIVVGTLVDIGVGRIDPDTASRALSMKTRASAGQTAPAAGLTFWRVEYPPEVWNS